ncbi:MAG: DUF6293 family protein [Candidatus Methanoplasma sp.]|jgi:hypothetical protein|nr:DUF6293 family protein [Candidatus Methanoplasma sp.]
MPDEAPRKMPRKESVMIACVTFETAKITEPIEYYMPTRVYLIHDVRDDDPKNVFREFYDGVHNQIKSKLGEDTEIKPRNTKVTNFTNVLREVLEVIEEERRKDEDIEINVNISAGSNEYAAAATVASMMNAGVVPFSVSTREFMIPSEDIRKHYYENDKPIGLTRSTYPQKKERQLQRIEIDMPSENLVRALRVLYGQKGGLTARSGGMIEKLKEEKLWADSGEVTMGRQKKDTKQRQSDAVRYQRNFVDRWKENGWIEKNDNGRYVVTKAGNVILDTFHTLPPKKTESQ